MSHSYWQRGQHAKTQSAVLSLSASSSCTDVIGPGRRCRQFIGNACAGYRRQRGAKLALEQLGEKRGYAHVELDTVYSLSLVQRSARLDIASHFRHPACGQYRDPMDA